MPSKDRVLLIGGLDARCVAVVRARGGSIEGNAGAAILCLLPAQALARVLQIGVADQRIEIALGDLDVGGGNLVAPLIRHIVEEAHRHPLVGGVVVYSLGGNGEGGHASVHFQRRPGKQAFLDLSGTHGGIAGGFVGLLIHLPRNLVVAVTVSHVANED